MVMCLLLQVHLTLAGSSMIFLTVCLTIQHSIICMICVCSPLAIPHAWSTFQCICKIFHMSWNIFQVVADSSQGWINAILYVFFSKKMRKRLFRDSFIQLMKCCRQSVHSRRKRITSRQSKLLSEANRLVGELSMKRLHTQLKVMALILHHQKSGPLQHNTTTGAMILVCILTYQKIITRLAQWAGVTLISQPNLLI